MDNLRIDGERLWASLMEMARIGATAKGGNNRQALTDLDGESRALFRRWCEDAGCTVTVDAMGNMFARRPGRDPSRPPILAGSHLDTQPTGGRFDGVLGVLAALEVVRTLNDHGVETDAPIEIVNWTNEEGARFPPPMIGSGVFAGAFTLEEAYGKAALDGATLGAELERIGYAGPEACGGRPVGAYFEVHIEQGPILEAEGKAIGVVTGAQGMFWYELEVVGRESHAGTTPMDRRRDALLAAARLVDAVNRIGLARGDAGRATVGVLQASPGSPNVIPGRVFMTVDLRNPREDELVAMDRELRTAAAVIGGETGTTIAVNRTWSSPPVHFDDACVAAVRDGAARGGYGHRDIVSGAGHDAVYMARVAPSAMIFVPCEDGISHNEAENIEPADAAAGCHVLLHAVLDRANA